MHILTDGGTATGVVIGLLATITGATLRMTFALGKSLERLEAHERRISSLEAWRSNQE